MNDFVETKAIRNYDIKIAKGLVRCDCCKSFKTCFSFFPQQSLHNFDNIFLCRVCATKCGFDIREKVLDELNDD